jgi:hypothetical protein
MNGRKGKGYKRREMKTLGGEIAEVEDSGSGVWHLCFRNRMGLEDGQAGEGADVRT